MCFIYTGTPYLLSNVDSLLGVLCGTPVKFTCYTFEPTLIFDWYIDDSPLISYSYRGEALPVHISTNRSMFRAEVVISSASVDTTSGNVHYGNVTLTTSLESLIHIQGSNISCGSFFQRSNFVWIKNYILHGKRTVGLFNIYLKDIIIHYNIQTIIIMLQHYA